MYVHAEVIRRFGRFASRNQFLGRINTAEEDEALGDGTCFGAKGWDMTAARQAWLEKFPEYS